MDGRGARRVSNGITNPSRKMPMPVFRRIGIGQRALTILLGSNAVFCQVTSGARTRIVDDASEQVQNEP